jgi:hypothetical protein
LTELSAAYCLPYIRLPEVPNQHVVTLKMATAVFAKTLDNFQHLMQLIPKSQSVTEINSAEENICT